MSHDFKPSGSIRAGFAYQDLVAVEILIDFLRDRDRYEWVQVEAVEEGFRSIDDVVACRKDGRFELTQVKFTLDPASPDHRLDWEWLTARKRAGTSLVQKWAKTTLEHVRNGTLATAMLKTDRKPDEDFGGCLSGSRVDYVRIPLDVQRTLREQIGSSEDVTEFFENFDFAHSRKRLDDYEEVLRARLRHELDSGGWARFKQYVETWATRRNKPGPDGRIRHFHLMRIFSPEHPMALPQDFVVPVGYGVPDQEFHAELTAQCTTADGVTVLWGPPGRGKSTYLSHCVAEWGQKEGLIAIRHHYYLQLQDRSEGRFSYFAIDRSFRHQIEEAGLPTGDRSSGLGEALAHAASAAEAEGKRMVVVVDGLDHVWREDGDIAQMNELFRRLLPLPTGVRLVVGTQRVEDKYLPVPLLTKLPKDRWTEQPTMSVFAVRKWLASQCAAGRVPIEEMVHRTPAETIEELATELHTISGGLPLHLVYSVEALLESGKPLTPSVVAELPVCPSGDIEVYYESLWTRLAPVSKRALHLLAGLQFAPPLHGLRSCLSGDWASVVDEAGHLLEFREASISPFHSSLFAFLRRRSEHEREFEALAAEMVRWLEQDAPAYWKRAWLWMTKAQLGDVTNLVYGPTRKWAIEWLKDAYPIDQLVHVLNTAEEAALKAADFRSLLRLRSIKVAAANARDFQTEDWGGFYEVAFSSSNDPDLAAVLRDNIPTMRVEELPAVADRCSATVRNRVVQELDRRVSARTTDGLGGGQGYSGAIVRIVARGDVAKADEIVKFAKRTGQESLIEEYARESLRAGNWGSVLAIARRQGGYELDRLAFAALCVEGIGPKGMGLAGATEPALQCLALLVDGECDGDIAVEDVSPLPTLKRWEAPLGLGTEIRRAGYRVFFGALATALAGGMPEGRTLIGQGAGTWLGKSFRELERMAGQVGADWLQEGRWPTLGEVYNSFSLRRPVAGSPEEWLIGIRLALLDIAVDVCAVGVGAPKGPRIVGEDVRTASTSPFWLTELWLGAFYRTPVPLHSADGADALLALVAADLKGRVIQFDERAATLIRAARFAFDHDLEAACEAGLENASECLLGYGWRKDMYVFEVIDALRTMGDRDDAEAKETLLALAGEIEHITEYTDGDETSHAREELHKAVVDYFPGRTPRLYADLLQRQEWRRAERVLTMYAERIEDASKRHDALLSTFLSPAEFSVAWETTAEYPEANRMDVRSRLVRLAGRDGPSGASSEGASSEPTVDVSAFAPGHLSELLESLRDEPSTVGRNVVSHWLTYWESKNRSEDALADIDAHVEKGHADYRVRRAFDTVFEVSRRQAGRTTAYRWLGRANIEGRGWAKWWSSSEAFEQRVRSFVSDYRERWREFVVETSRREVLGGADDNGIEVGMSRLVYFLVEVGEVELARDLTMEMVSIFREEVAPQPLSTPEWAR